MNVDVLTGLTATAVVLGGVIATYVDSAAQGWPRSQCDVAHDAGTVGEGNASLMTSREPRREPLACARAGQVIL